MTEDRKAQLRAWAAWNVRAMECHSTEEGVEARRETNRIADGLGDFTESDWGVIRNAQREYRTEES